MSEYVPDRWVVIEMSSSEGTYRKVLASWYGGYLGSDSWKLSSGITEVKDCDTYYEFLNESGSVYKCYKQAYGMSGYTSGIYRGWEQQQKDTFKIKVVEEYEQPL